MKVALVGAESPGKTRLAAELAEQLRLQGRRVAIDSGMLVEDGEVLDSALERPWHYDVTLLMGLELPLVADGLQCEGPATREQIDRRLRELLTASGIAFCVVYGHGEARLANALAALGFNLAAPAPGSAAQDPDPAGAEASPRPKRWQWNCDKCSDPDCEHRLFTLGLEAEPARSKIDR